MRSGSNRGGRAALAIIVLAGLTAAATGPRAHDRPAGLPAPPRRAAADRADSLLRDFVFKLQNVGGLVLSVSNHGFLGNNFSERGPSMEYPKGSEVDHLIRGGVWAGGINTNFETFVTTGVQDGYWGTYSAPTEWEPAGIPPAEYALGWIRERSRLETSPYYDPANAVSEQDLVTSFVDTLDHAHTPETGNADTLHVASGLVVRQESFAWSYQPADAMVLVRWTLVPTRTISAFHFGIYAELTSGWKGKYPFGDWPPASANWFGHHQLYWVDDLPEYADPGGRPLNLVAEHHFTYDAGRAPEHAGIKFLGARRYDALAGRWEEGADQVAWHWWDWEPGSDARNVDLSKYAVLSEPGVDDWELIQPAPDNTGDNPISLLCVGPWELAPGGYGQAPDTLEIAFGFLGGDDFGDLVDNARFAQNAYDNDFRLPGPPPSPRLKVVTEQSRIHLYWDDGAERSVDVADSLYDFEGYRLYAGGDATESALSLVKQWDLDALPAINPELSGVRLPYFTQEWLDSAVAAGAGADAQGVLDALWPDRYRYRAGAEFPFLVTETDSIGYNTGLGAIRMPPDEWIREAAGADTTVYKYRFTLEPAKDGHAYYVGVTSFDQGSRFAESYESGVSQNLTHAVPGRSPAQARGRAVTVFPNPYRGGAVWDRNRATGRYLWFAGLPRRALIKIFTLAGDQVAEIDFDAATYTAANAPGVFAGAEGEAPPVLSGSMAAWDLRSFNGQPVATGLYLFSVTDRGGGGTQQGKFLVLK